MREAVVLPLPKSDDCNGAAEEHEKVLLLGPRLTGGVVRNIGWHSHDSLRKVGECTGSVAAQALPPMLTHI